MFDFLKKKPEKPQPATPAEAPARAGFSPDEMAYLYSQG